MQVVSSACDKFRKVVSLHGFTCVAPVSESQEEIGEEKSGLAIDGQTRNDGQTDPWQEFAYSHTGFCVNNMFHAPEAVSMAHPPPLFHCRSFGHSYVCRRGSPQWPIVSNQSHIDFTILSGDEIFIPTPYSIDGLTSIQCEGGDFCWAFL